MIVGRLSIRPSVGSSVSALRLWQETETANKQRPRGVWSKIETKLLEANLSISAGLLVTGVFVVGILAVSLLVLLFGQSIPISVLLVSIFTPLLPFFYVQARISKKKQAIEVQLIEALEMSVRALRAGHPLVGAFELVAAEVPAPLGESFARICQKNAMGTPLEQCLTEEEAELRQRDFSFFASAVVLNSQFGGNVAVVLEKAARIIRSRQRSAKKFRGLLAQTQYSKRILLFLPPMMYVLLSVMDPTYMAPFHQEALGSILFFLSWGLLGLGWAVMTRMAQTVGEVG